MLRPRLFLWAGCPVSSLRTVGWLLEFDPRGGRGKTAPSAGEAWAEFHVRPRSPRYPPRDQMLTTPAGGTTMWPLPPRIASVRHS